MNYNGLKKQTFIETGIIVAVTLVLVAVVFLLGSIRDDYVESNDTAKRLLTSIEAEFNQIQAKYSFIKQNGELYEKVRQKQEDGMLTIDRQAILERFNKYKSQYNLTNLRLSVSPVADVKQPNYDKETSKIRSSEVSIQLETLTDERVYEMLKSMDEDLSGLPRISRLSMVRENKLNDEVIQTLRQKGYYPLIRTAVKFTWYSINPTEDPNGVANAGP